MDILSHTIEVVALVGTALAYGATQKTRERFAEAVRTAEAAYQSDSHPRRIEVALKKSNGSTETMYRLTREDDGWAFEYAKGTSLEYRGDYVHPKTFAEDTELEWPTGVRRSRRDR